MTETSQVKARQIIENAPEEIKVEGWEEVLVKLPTIRERLLVKEELKKLPSYDLMTDMEKNIQEAYLIALKCLYKPSITIKEYLDSPDIKIFRLLDAVSHWYGLKMKVLNDERSVYIKDFLPPEKED